MHSLLTPSKALRRSQFAVKDALAESKGSDNSKGRGRGARKGKGRGKGKDRGKGKGKSQVNEDKENEEKEEEQPNKSHENKKKKKSSEDEETPISAEASPADPLPKKRPRKTQVKEDIAAAPAESEIPKGGKRLKVTETEKHGKKDEGKKDDETPTMNGKKTKEPKGTKEAKPKKSLGGDAVTFARRYQPSSGLPKAKWEALREAFSIYIKPALEHYSAHEDPPYFFVFCCARECQNHPEPIICFLHVYRFKWSIFHSVVITNDAGLLDFLL